MLIEDHEVFSVVTGGRPRFTSAAVGGGAPGRRSPVKSGPAKGRIPPRAAVPEATRPGASEPRKRLHDPYLIKMQTI